MKKNFVTAVVFTACAAFAQAQTAARPPAAAANVPPAGSVTLPTKVAVIDIQVAIMNTSEGKAAGASLTAKYQPRKDEFDKRQRDIQAMQDQLKKGSATMSDDAKTKQERDIDNKTKALQRDTQETSDDYEQEMGKVFNEIGGKMMQIIEQYSYQNGYAVVLDASNRQQSSVLWAAPSSNITADIIKLYDQAHPAASTPTAGAAKPATPAAPPRPPTQIKK